MRNKTNPTIIEVKDCATERQIELLQKINPDSLIVREGDIDLGKFYEESKTDLDKIYEESRTVTYYDMKKAFENYKKNCQ